MKIDNPILENSYTLADAATILVDASLGNFFIVTLGGDRALGIPSNPSPWQRIIFAVRQPNAGGPYTLSFTGGAGGYRFGSTFSSVTLSTGANAVDYVGTVYNAIDEVWDLVSLSQGF